jgi:hypothetical protein
MEVLQFMRQIHAPPQELQTIPITCPKYFEDDIF